MDTKDTHAFFILTLPPTTLLSRIPLTVWLIIIYYNCLVKVNYFVTVWFKIMLGELWKYLQRD